MDAKNTDDIVKDANSLNVGDPLQEHSDEELARFLGEPVENGKTVSPETGKADNKSEDKTQTDTSTRADKTTTAAAPTIQPPENAIDPEKITADIEAKVDKKLEEFVGKLDATTEQKADVKKDLLADAPWKKENRDPTWEEALAYMADINKEKVKQEIMADFQHQAEEEEKKQAEEKTRVETEQKTTNEYYTKQWDDEFSELEKSGKIPAVKEIGNPKDPGVMARLEILTAMQRVTQENLAVGKPPLMSAKLAFYEHYKSPTEQPPGADAPIAGAGKTVIGGQAETFTNAEIKNTSFEDLLMGR